jgi:hypothetical protein
VSREAGNDVAELLWSSRIFADGAPMGSTPLRDEPIESGKRPNLMTCDAGNIEVHSGGSPATDIHFEKIIMRA